MTKIKWDSSLYDSKHAFVSSYGEDLLSLLMPRASQRILDIGCGTGHLASKIAESGAQVIGIDNSEEMIRAARLNYPKLTFEVKDASSFCYNEPFDAIFSNATLHWVLEKEEAVQCMVKNLKPGGKLVAEFGGKGNVSTMLAAYNMAIEKLTFKLKKKPQFPWYFPSVGEYASVLESFGFEVQLAVLFYRETELATENGIKDWFRMFGEKLFEGFSEPEVEQVLEEIQHTVMPILYKNGKWHADYKRIRIVAVKP